LWIDGYKTAVAGDEGADGRLFVLLEGSEATVDRGTRDLRSGIGRAGVPETKIIDAGAREAFERVVDAYITSIGERSITYRVSAYVDDVQRRAEAMIALAKRFELRHDVIVDIMNGDIVLRVSDLDALSLGAKIEMFDDALHDDEPGATVIAGKHPNRANLKVWGEPPATIERMRDLKKAFDPKGILNPGRFLV
jgi:FAD/FMN-containing dehydrogenase